MGGRRGKGRAFMELERLQMRISGQGDRLVD